MSMIGNFVSIIQAEINYLYQSPKRIHTFLEEVDEANRLDIDKAWHGIHFLLTGKSYGGKPPLANVIFGITPIGKEDVGYGATLGTPASIVREIAIAVNKISKSDLAQIFEPEALEQANIYPSI